MALIILTWRKHCLVKIIIYNVMMRPCLEKLKLEYDFKQINLEKTLFGKDYFL